jgi:P-type Cu2+ transporter
MNLALPRRGIRDKIKLMQPSPRQTPHELEGHTPRTAHNHDEMTHRGDLTDPHDINSQAIAPAGHASHDAHTAHEPHTGHDKHAGHSVELFRDRFWLSLLLSIPVVLYSDKVQDWLNFSMPSFPGSGAIVPVLGTVIFLYGGTVFLKGGWDEIRARTPGMMLLISLAISVAFIASALTTLGLFDLDFWWELALLVTIMLLGHWQEVRAIGQAQGALSALAALLPEEAERITATGAEMVAVSDLRNGDVILVRPGGRVPADGSIVDGRAEIDESMITGESRPVDRGVDDHVVAGSVVVGSSVRVRVEATGEETALAGIQRLVAEAQASRSRAQALADRFAAALFYIAVGAGIITFAVWSVIGDVEDAVARAVTVLVISCPHALGLAIPLVIAISTAAAARQGILIKDRLALERMRLVDTVLFDKTGTLTLGQHVVTGIASLTDDDDELLALAAAVESDSEHPLARAIVQAAATKGVQIPKATGFRAIAGRGVEATVDGATVAVGGPTMLRERNLIVPPALADRTRSWAERGAGVLHVVRDGLISGAVALEDQVRPESREAIEALHQQGVRVVMITGDARSVAEGVAAELGVDEVFAEVLPEDKERTVAELQKRGATVAMVGDGVNDAPALARADVGIAIGAGTDVAIESAGVILATSDPRAVVGVRNLSKASYRKMIQNLGWVQHRRNPARRRRACADRVQAPAGGRGSADEPLDNHRRPQRPAPASGESSGERLNQIRAGTDSGRPARRRARHEHRASSSLGQRYSSSSSAAWTSPAAHACAACSSDFEMVCPPASQCRVTSAPPERRRSARRLTCGTGTNGSLRPAPMKTLVSLRSGVSSGSKGSIGLSSAAAISAPASRRSKLAAILAPFEKPIAITLPGSNPYSAAAASMNRASSPVRNARSSWSSTPSARRRKKRGASPSSTFPRGLSTPAPGKIAWASGISVVSSPPVPCSASRVTPATASASGFGGM